MKINSDFTPAFYQKWWLTAYLQRFDNEHIWQAAHSSQVTVPGLAAHLGQCTQSMQNGRLVLAAGGGQVLFDALVGETAQPLEDSVWVEARVLVFMAMK